MLHVPVLQQAQQGLQGMSDERLESAVAAGLAEARQQQAADSNALPAPQQQKSTGSLPAPDSLEASETNALEETYAATHH